MTTISYNVALKRQKMYIRAYAIFLIFVLVVGGAFLYSKWNQYVTLKNGLAANEKLIVNLSDQLVESGAEYATVKDDFDTFKAQVETDLKSIFPPNDQYKELTRKFDEFEKELNQPSRNNPFEVSSLDFQPVKKTDNYSILPVRLSVRSSRDNFTQFLHLIETSGSLNNKLRLMDISSIRLNFENSSENPDEEIINFTVQINAYFE